MYLKKKTQVAVKSRYVLSFSITYALCTYVDTLRLHNNSDSKVFLKRFLQKIFTGKSSVMLLQPFPSISKNFIY